MRAKISVAVSRNQRKKCKSAQLFSASESTPIKTDGFAESESESVDTKVEHAFNENVFKNTELSYLLV